MNTFDLPSTTTTTTDLPPGIPKINRKVTATAPKFTNPRSPSPASSSDTCSCSRSPSPSDTSRIHLRTKKQRLAETVGVVALAAQLKKQITEAWVDLNISSPGRQIDFVAPHSIDGIESRKSLISLQNNKKESSQLTVVHADACSKQNRKYQAKENSATCQIQPVLSWLCPDAKPSLDSGLSPTCPSFQVASSNIDPSPVVSNVSESATHRISKNSDETDHLSAVSAIVDAFRDALMINIKNKPGFLQSLNASRRNTLSTTSPTPSSTKQGNTVSVRAPHLPNLNTPTSYANTCPLSTEDNPMQLYVPSLNLQMQVNFFGEESSLQNRHKFSISLQQL